MMPETAFAPLPWTAEDVTGVLRHGARVAIENGYAVQPVPLKVAVWALLQEAADTVKRLPDRELRWLTSNERCAWPEVVRQTVDEFANAVARGGTWGAVRIIRGAPSPGAIDRMDHVLDWLRVIESKNRIRDIRVLYALAAGVPVHVIRRLYGTVGRRTVYDIRERGIKAICVALNRQYGVPL